MSYCKYVKDLEKENVHKVYHDNFYGVNIKEDSEIFGRLIMEINQAGLSWNTILKKENNFRLAYNNFDIKKISKYEEKETDRLMSDAGIIRNKLKIAAAIYNAKEVLKIQKESESFLKWIDTQNKIINKTINENIKDGKISSDKKLLEIKKSWVKVFKSRFKFVGGEIVGEFLMSLGYYKSPHSEDCKRFKKLNSF